MHDRSAGTYGQWIQLKRESRKKACSARIVRWGLIDTLRRLHPQAAGLYSWWDYRDRGFALNNGLRIDQLFATLPLAARCEASYIDRQERAEREDDKPSDHVPVVADFATGLVR